MTTTGVSTLFLDGFIPQNTIIDNLPFLLFIEHQLDSDEDKKEKEKKATKFEGEDEVDPEELEKKKKEEARKAAELAQANARVKNKSLKPDYDKAFEER